MSPISLAVVLFASWSGTFEFDAPVFSESGIPEIEGTVNLHEPGVPMYPVKTVFVPVPQGVEPVLGYAALPSRRTAPAGTVPRAGVLSGEGLEASMVPADPVDRTFDAAELRGVFPLAGTQVAVIDIYPFTNAGFTPSVSISLDWQGGGSGMPVPAGHLLSGLAEGDRYWPSAVNRAESPFWGKPWARLSIEESGGYRVTCDDLENAGCQVSGSPIGSIALFSGPGTQFEDQPETEHQLSPVAITVDDNDSDGFFGSGDEIHFLAGGLNRFEFTNRAYRWLWHRYATHRIYWLTWGSGNGARMTQVQGVPDGSPSWGGAADYIVHLEDGGYWTPRWENRTGWFWMKIGSGDQESVPLNLGYAAGPGVVTLSFAVTDASPFTVTLGGYGSYQSSGSGVHTATFENVNLASSSQIPVSFSSSDPVADMFLDFVEIEFPAELSASSRRIFFPGQNARFNFSFPGGEYAFDASNLMDPVMITGTEQSGGSLAFSLQLSDSTSLMVLGEDDWLIPDTISPANPGRLVGTVASGDRLLVVPEVFSDDALALEALLESMGLSVVTGTTREIYDEFGQGVKDPGAIRSAVRWGMDSWSEPLGAVILCGDGHYDPLGYSTTLPDLVPAQIYLRNSQSYPAWASEDWFAQVHENSVYPEIPVARIPAGNAAAFGAVCAKSSMYASGQAGGSWSSRFVLLADDEWGNGTADQENDHTDYMEDMCYGTLFQNVHPEKLYLIDFPWPPGTSSSGIHPEKPEAREAFLDAWNQGMAGLVFLGHGSANQITHEKTMLGDDPASLENGARLPIALFMSCDISKFFVPGVDCIGEKVVYHPGGGAIASVGATGGTTYPGNATLAEEILSLMLEERRSMGYSFWAGKLVAARAGNSSYYAYLGCPDLYLEAADPLLQISLEGDTLFSGQVNRVAGTAVSSDGLALLEISESDIPWQYTMLGGGIIEYFRQGGTAWRGRSAMSQGEFSADCVIPYSCSTGTLARIDGAAVVASGAELGLDAPLVLEQGEPPADFQGPEISMWISGQQGVGEPVVTEEGILEAELSDPSGINFLGRTGNSIRLFVDSDEYDLSDAFSYNTGSTTTGQLQYTVSGLAQGQHRFILRAMDGAGNVSSDTLMVLSTDADEVAIQQHLVYPNPGSGTRCFSFSLSTEAHVTVSIYTASGRRIRRLSSLCGLGYNQIIWDGLDADGDIPASGAYIYMIEAQTESGLFSQSSSVTGVLATVN